jgi:NADH-quinone oxidoreductase subunit L
MDLIWLIPLLPGLGAAVNGLVGIRFFSKRTAGLVANAAMAAALALALYAFWQLLALPAEGREHTVRVAAWIPSIPLALSDGTIGSFAIPWGFRLDPLSGMMILVVTGIGFLIHVYSIGYMHGETRGAYARYFAYLNLFAFFMLMLVLGDNFVVMFVGWEGVGLCSYLLIGYWYEKKSASDAGKKAFIVNRIGDWGFVVGMFLVFSTFGTLDFRTVANAAGSMPVEAAGFGTLSLITLLLFVGATGKSAQIPLYVWLPDAMEGPTPVSALIHAATMVTAGVYMVGRNAVLFSHAPMTMEVVAVVGVATAFLAATIGLVQNDIKRVLAYSTVSQLGFMFLAMGVGAFAAGAFHLMTHAFFKALLFLCSGSVIHAMAGQQDMRHMGGLKTFMPVTFVTMLVGTLAIAGIPPLSGFFSKDEILYRAFLDHKVIWGVAVVTALMTAFYMYRLMSLTFFGAYRGPAWTHGGGHGAAAHAGPDDAGHHGDAGASRAVAGGDHSHGAASEGGWHGPHESPKSMTVPLQVLAVGALIAGFVGIPAALGGGNAIEHFLEPSFSARTVSAAHGSGAAAPAHGAVLSEAVGTAESTGTAHEATGALEGAASRAVAAGEHAEGSEPGSGGGHLSRAAELGLMALSVLVGVIGILAAYRFYVRAPEIAENLARRWSGAHRVLSNKYYVDELYGATVVAGTMGAASGLWVFDKSVVDGAVNGSGWLTVVSAWISHLVDKYLVDGIVNLVGAVLERSSFVFRRIQTGLVQNYALLMLFGIFAFVSVYLFVR